MRSTSAFSLAQRLSPELSSPSQMHFQDDRWTISLPSLTLSIIIDGGAVEQTAVSTSPSAFSLYLEYSQEWRLVGLLENFASLEKIVLTMHEPDPENAAFFRRTIIHLLDTDQKYFGVMIIGADNKSLHSASVIDCVLHRFSEKPVDLSFE